MVSYRETQKCHDLRMWVENPFSDMAEYQKDLWRLKHGLPIHTTTRTMRCNRRSRN